MINVASSAYHHLHVNQLRAMALVTGDHRFDAVAARFEGYLDSRLNFACAFGRKVLFRVVVPRNRLLANRLPWSPRLPE